MKCYLFQLVSILITFKKVAFCLKNISLSGWIWRILPKTKKKKALIFTTQECNEYQHSVLAITLTLWEVFWKLFHKFSNTVQKEGGVRGFQSLYFLIWLSALEKKQSWSWQSHPNRSGSLVRAPSPTTTTSVPLGLLTLSPVSPIRVLLAKDHACSSACGHSDAISQQPTKSNAEHCPVLQSFLELWRPFSL